MFTGIIEEIGTVSQFINRGRSAQIAISVKRAFSDLEIGSSISVNGICLTVTSIARNAFSADISEESLKVSNLSRIKIGDKVNLERALSLASRLGGHIMTGHVDGIVELRGKVAVDDGYEIIFSAPQSLRKYIILKGSVGIEGISLTVARLTNDGFSVVIIPHTARTTILNERQIGDKLNFEADVISKYLEGLLSGDQASPTEKIFLNAGFLPIGIVDN